MKILLISLCLFLPLLVNSQTITGGLLCLDSAKIVQLVETKRDFVDCQIQIGIMGEMLLRNDAIISNDSCIIKELKAKNADEIQNSDAFMNQMVKAQADFKKEHTAKNLWKATALSIPAIIGILIIIFTRN